MASFLFFRWRHLGPPTEAMPPTQGSGWSSRTRAGSPPNSRVRPQARQHRGACVLHTSLYLALWGSGLCWMPNPRRSRSAGARQVSHKPWMGLCTTEVDYLPLCDLWGGVPSWASTAPSVQWEGSRPTVQGCCRAPSDGAGSVWPSSWCSLST